MKTVVFSLLLLFCLPVYSQKSNFDIKGLWRGYSSLADTTNKGSGGVWLLFNDTACTMLVSFTDLPPEPIGRTSRYICKNKTISFVGDPKSDVLHITILNPNLIWYDQEIEGKKDRTYLKREWSK